MSLKHLGNQSVQLCSPPAIAGFAAVCGPKEGQGPLRHDFDYISEDSYFGEQSWEKAESMLQTEAANLAIRKAGLQKKDINMVFAGDLLNQCISSTFGLRGMDIPFLGQYGACSTMAQTLIMASIMVECGAANYACAVTSSLLHRGAAIPHAAGIRQPARADCAVDGDSFGQRGAWYERRHSSAARDRGTHCRSRCDRHDEHGRGDGPRCSADFAGLF